MDDFYVIGNDRQEGMNAEAEGQHKKGGEVHHAGAKISARPTISLSSIEFRAGFEPQTKTRFGVMIFVYQIIGWRKRRTVSGQGVTAKSGANSS